MSVHHCRSHGDASFVGWPRVVSCGRGCPIDVPVTAARTGTCASGCLMRRRNRLSLLAARIDHSAGLERSARTS
eukprot:1430446-Heterocapsa_arctica.AAC.1